MRYVRIFGALLATAYTTFGTAQVQYSNAFLSIGQDARDLGLAPGHISFDSLGTYWNPANIGALTSPLHGSFFHMMQYGGIANYNTVGIRGHVAPQLNAAVTYVRWGIDNIPNTLDLLDAAGQVHYEKVTAFSAVDHAILAAVAYRGTLSKFRRASPVRFMVGAQAKMVFRKVGTFARSQGYGLDLGAKVLAGPWRAALSLRDITGTFNIWHYTFTDKQRQQLERTGNAVPVRTVENTPPSLLLGVGYEARPLSALAVRPEVTLMMPFDGRGMDPRVGVEVAYHERFFFRMGAHRFQRITSPAPEGRSVTIVSPSFGVGFVYDIFAIDYALADMGTASLLPVSHALSLRVMLRRPPISQAHHPTSK